MRRVVWQAAGVACAHWLVAARAELPVEQPGAVAVLPPAQSHWIVVSDFVLQRSAFVDLDAGAFLGMVSTGYGVQEAAWPRTRAEFYLPETYYSRGTRGARSDVVTVYDQATLAPLAEIPLPPKRATNTLATGNVALSDDDRFLAVFNMTPATSLSIADVAARAFVGEVATPGCSLVYAAGPRSFMMLCADGALLHVALREDGRPARLERSAPFFDPERDPITEKAVRAGMRWLFVSFEGQVHEVDWTSGSPRFAAPWSLVDDALRAEGWRIGGSQILALHAPSGRLYVLMHQGGPDSHKDAGTELWVYDLASHSRVQRIPARHPGFEILGESPAFGRDWPTPFDGFYDWLLDNVAPHPGIDRVVVTQDGHPLVATSSERGGSLAIYDGLTGEFLRRVGSGGLSPSGLAAPFGAATP
ncbi:MAG TPA: amine dehydrogenase large subunit [Myxococcota bacterium]|nr:amine dehydrogenase large subunit [Myxococcota bacterium]